MALFNTCIGKGVMVIPIRLEDVKILPKTLIAFRDTDQDIVFGCDAAGDYFGWVPELNSTIPFNNGICEGCFFKVKGEVGRSDLLGPKGKTALAIELWVPRKALRDLQNRVTLVSLLLSQHNQDLKDLLGVTTKFVFEDPDCAAKIDANRWKLRTFLASLTKDVEFAIEVLDGTARQFNQARGANDSTQKEGYL